MGPRVELSICKAQADASFSFLLLCPIAIKFLQSTARLRRFSNDSVAVCCTFKFLPLPPACVFFSLALVHPLYLYLLRASLVISCPLSQDSKCTVPDATTAAVAAMTTGLSGSERNSWLSLLSTPNCSRTPKAHRFQ